MSEELPPDGPILRSMRWEAAREAAQAETVEEQ